MAPMREVPRVTLTFGLSGGTAKLIVDNVRAAVRRCDWFEPELNPKVREFCAHYGTVMLPTRPAMPRMRVGWRRVPATVFRIL